MKRRIRTTILLYLFFMLGVLFGILGIIIDYFQSISKEESCFIWYGSNDSRNKVVSCSLITDEYCEKLGCKKVVWSCGAPACLC
ncbi:MAG: hypothetical protein QXJ14_02075 [Candidatus Aenigmatarchaeota archaeon]